MVWATTALAAFVKRVLDVMPRQNVSVGALSVDPFCSQSPSGWTEGPASSKETHRVIKEVDLTFYLVLVLVMVVKEVDFTYNTMTFLVRVSLSFSAWRRCALDIVCSANTIRSYINRFGKDCNGDALVTCEDYTMIHKNGGWNCGTSLVGSNFWDIFQTCKDTVIGRGLNIWCQKNFK